MNPRRWQPEVERQLWKTNHALYFFFFQFSSILLAPICANLMTKGIKTRGPKHVDAAIEKTHFFLFLILHFEWKKNVVCCVLYIQYTQYSVGGLENVNGRH